MLICTIQLVNNWLCSHFLSISFARACSLLHSTYTQAGRQCLFFCCFQFLLIHTKSNIVIYSRTLKCRLYLQPYSRVLIWRCFCFANSKQKATPPMQMQINYSKNLTNMIINFQQTIVNYTYAHFFQLIDSYGMDDRSC